MQLESVIIVEGKNDKKLLRAVLAKDVQIICTYGTFGIEKFDDMLEAYDLDNRDVYIFVDADKSGMELRKSLSKELPHARHLYISKDTGEVEKALAEEIALIVAPYFPVKKMFKYRK